MKCRISKQVTGRILSATVSQSPSGKYFVSLCCTDVEIEPLPKTNKAIGLDVGLKSFAVTSDGQEYTNHKYLAKSQKKLARLQRQLSRKTKAAAPLSHPNQFVKDQSLTYEAAAAYEKEGHMPNAFGDGCGHSPLERVSQTA